MKFDNINIKSDRKKVLIAPLDWGLGHATRCIPIIYELIRLNFEVIIAADGKVKNLLKPEFPDVVFTELKGYNIRYSSKGSLLPLRLLAQFPKLIQSIYTEHKWLKIIIEKYNIDIVISDNRLGLYHAAVNCIYITHQLKIKTGNHFTAWLAQKIHYYFINKYNHCWVPDNEFADDLAGVLSHPKKMPLVPVKYIGPLSRFEKITIEKKIDLLIILSGPEPQRTIFEAMLMKELNAFPGIVVVVRGLPVIEEKQDLILSKENKITIVDHLAAGTLSKVIQQSHLVICRSGYTSIMDLVKLEQKAILVPTPGQTEQEYLGNYLMEKKIFLTVSQDNFSMGTALKKAAGFSFTNLLLKENGYIDAVRGLAKTVA